MRENKIKKIGKLSFVHIVCIFLTILSILPFWIMLMNATRSTSAVQQGISLIPSTFLVSNWEALQNGGAFNALRGFGNSLFISVCSTGLSV